MSTALGDRLRAHVTPRLWQALRYAFIWCKAQRPQRLRWIVYRAGSVAPVELGDLTVETITLDAELTAEQRALILRDISDVSLARNRRAGHDGWEAICFARCAGQLCAYLFCLSAAPLRGKISAIVEPRARVLGPGYTAPEFRGRNVYGRLFQSVVHEAALHAAGPCYMLVYPWNEPPQRALAKAGWMRLGTWAGWMACNERWVRARRVGD